MYFWGMKYFSFRKHLLLLLFSIVFYTACERPEKVPPALFERDRFVLDFSCFEGFDSGGTNAKAAYSAVNSWQILLADTSLACFDVFDEYGLSEANYESAMYWSWSADFSYNESIYQTYLYGLTENDTVNWNQYVTLDTFVVDYRQMSGIEYTAGDSAEWTINNHPLAETESTLTFFTKKCSDGIQKQYTSGTTSVTYKDSVFDIYDSYWLVIGTSGDSVQMFLDKNTKAGRIQNATAFGSTDWQCWSELLQNADCNK